MAPDRTSSARAATTSASAAGAPAADAWSARVVGPVAGIRVGIGGWTHAPWRGGFYPRGLVQRRELEYASRHLSCLEINGTYHRAQSPATYARWRDQVPDGFLFAVKAPRRIVQSRALARTGPQVADFVGAIATLGDRLGPLLWQFEPGPGLQAGALAEFCDLLPRVAEGRPVRHVLEVRDPALADAGLVALARAQGVALAFTDSTEHPSFADVTTGFVYARLMRARPQLAAGYTPGELAAWARRARAWAAGGEPGDLRRITAQPPTPAPRDVFIQFIGAAKQRNPAAAMALIARLAGT